MAVSYPNSFQVSSKCNISCFSTKLRFKSSRISACSKTQDQNLHLQTKTSQISTDYIMGRYRYMSGKLKMETERWQMISSSVCLDVSYYGRCLPHVWLWGPLNVWERKERDSSLPGSLPLMIIRATSESHICVLNVEENERVSFDVDLKIRLITMVDLLLDSVKWDDKGLAVAIAQNVDTGDVLMQGFVNRDALRTTVSSRKATFYSRSRSTLWTKGETSSNFINVCDIFIDCDRDSIIYLGKPDGPTCHTGSETCYYTSVDDVLNDAQVEDNKLASSTLYSLESTISKRKEELSVSPNDKPSSWTKRLLLDDKLLCSKIREEADELCRTLEENEDKSRTASEMGDVLYHAMVLLAIRGVKFEEVLQVLRHRFSQSGIEEKKSRKS